MLVKIYRSYHQHYTTGEAYIESDGRRLLEFNTLELPFRYNLPNRSCILPGIYPLVLEYSPKFERNLYELYNVRNRSEIKFHPANYIHQLEGCIAPGELKDIDKDGVIDVYRSNLTLNKMHEILGSYAVIDIR